MLTFPLVHADRAVSTDALIDAVWGPDRGGAVKRLQMAITRLRGALQPLGPDGENLLRTVSGGYLLAIGPGELDAEVFAKQIQAGRGELEQGDTARAEQLLSGALALWRGPALADVAFEDFAQPEIRCLEELRLLALEARAEAQLRLGQDAEIVGELEALIFQHPTRERLASLLMLALYRSGRQADALEVYQRTRTRLAGELGLEPGPELKQLQAEILDQAGVLDPTIRTERPGELDDRDSGRGGRLAAGQSRLGVLPVPPTPTIGRQREIAKVVSLLEEPDVRLVTLPGPGGVGETRLALAARARSSHRSAVGRAGSSLPAWPARRMSPRPSLVRSQSRRCPGKMLRQLFAVISLAGTCCWRSTTSSMCSTVPN